MKEKLQSTFGENLKIRLDPNIRLDFDIDIDTVHLPYIHKLNYRLRGSL